MIPPKICLLSLCISFLLINTFCFSQNQKYNSKLIPDELRKNANAVIRENSTVIEIEAYNKITQLNKRVITILNSSGKKHINAFENYDLTTSIKNLEAAIYDANGNLIKKFKKSKFNDVSAVDGGTLYSDSRVKYLEYTLPIKFPYTVVFTSEVTYSTTAFITPWFPLESYNLSTEKSTYKVINNSGVTLKSKKSNFEGFNIKELDSFSFFAENLKAITYEIYNLGFKNLAPSFKVAMEKFDMKGVTGSNKNWKDFGKWMHDKLINNTKELPESVLNEVRALIPENSTDLEKAKIVYQYMQNKTRYVGVQVGIGGWRPINAEDVDRMGYGDCKGLSNYTKALLEAVGVETYYAVIYGGKSIRSLDKDFSSTQGNHVVLAIPTNNNYVWLECTSQTNPFGYIGNFTDDRDALLITPDGGIMVHTTYYDTSNNLTYTKANTEISETGDLSAQIKITTKGTHYSEHIAIENESFKDQKLTYSQDYWGDINTLKINKIEVSNDKDLIEFTENVEVTASKYARKIGNQLIFMPNFFDKLTYIPPKNNGRISDIKIDRGHTFKDEFILKIPKTTKVETIPDSLKEETPYGSYSFEVNPIDNHTLVIKRKLILNKGIFEASEYNRYRNFIKSIVKADQSKIILEFI